MKKIIYVLTLVMGMVFSAMVMVTNTVGAEEQQNGWVPVSDVKTGELIGMSNTGDHGGKLSLLCDVKTHKLYMTYEGGNNRYDLFVFYHNVDQGEMNTRGTENKFIVGLNRTTQKEVYYNVLKAKQTFVIARFPVGTGAKYLKASALGDGSVPVIQQEGDEMFSTGLAMRDMMRKLSVSCPISQNKGQAIF